MDRYRELYNKWADVEEGICVLDRKGVLWFKDLYSTEFYNSDIRMWITSTESEEELDHLAPFAWVEDDPMR